MTETIEKIGSSSSNNKSMGASTEKDDSDRSSKEGSVEPVSADSSRSTVCQVISIFCDFITSNIVCYFD